MNKNQVLFMIKHEVEKESLRVLQVGIKQYSICLIYALHSKLEMEKEQAQEFARYVSDVFDDVNAGRISLDDINQVVKEELDITVDMQ